MNSRQLIEVALNPEAGLVEVYAMPEGFSESAAAVHRWLVTNGFSPEWGAGGSDQRRILLPAAEVPRFRKLQGVTSTPSDGLGESADDLLAEADDIPAGPLDFAGAWRQAKADFASGSSEWREIDEAAYDELLGQMPPMLRTSTPGGSVFLVGEISKHVGGEPVHLAVLSRDGKRFVRMMPLGAYCKEFGVERPARGPMESEADQLLVAEDGQGLPPGHEAHEIQSDDLDAAASFVSDYGRREAAYEFLLGPEPDMRHVNRLESIYATTPEGRDVDKIEDYLKEHGLGEGDDKRALALEFLSLRSGKPEPEADRWPEGHRQYRDLSGNDPV